MLINENADRETSYTVWDYAEGQDLYQNAMLVDLTQPPDTVTHDMSVKISPPGKQAGWAVRSAAVCYFFLPKITILFRSVISTGPIFAKLAGLVELWL